jgi:electron-transferring-flavoprotein dehydrogenase
VEIFPGFAAAEVLYNDDGSVKGVATGNMGIGKDGEPTGNFQLGMELLGKYTVFAEGARGHLGKQLIAKFKLDDRLRPAELRHRHQGTVGNRPQAPPARLGAAHRRLADGERHLRRLLPVPHGGQQGRAGLHHRAGLQNPYLSPFEEFQRWKTHPNIRWYLEGDKRRITAKRLSLRRACHHAGGLLSLPKTVFPGGALVGCDAGYLNVSRIKGSHAAIKTGMLAAEAAYDAVGPGASTTNSAPTPRPSRRAGCIHRAEQGRNFKNWFKKGLTVATLMNGIEQFVLRGPHPLDAAPRQARPCLPEACRRVHAHRLPQARRQADL